MDISPIWLTLKLAGITTLLLLAVGLPVAVGAIKRAVSF